MKKVMSFAAAASIAASSAFAGTAGYPVEMTKDGVLYNCEAETIVVDGATARNCVVVGGSNEAGGGLFALGTGLSGAAIAGIIAAVVVVGGVIVNNNRDDDTPTNGTL